MTKEKLLEILNKKIEAAKKDVEYWYIRHQVATAKLDLLEELVDELSKLDPEEGESEEGE